MAKTKKILIIKTGFSEFMDRGISTTVSLGDVLMCTSLLHLYPNDHVTWVTSHSARKLLKKNPGIDKLLIFGPDALSKISKKKYDILINLEKDIGICTFLHNIEAKKRYGFYFDESKHDISTYQRSTEFLMSGQENHRDLKKTTFEILFEAVGERWNGQRPYLFSKNRLPDKYDIGFNFAVGSKWPTKAWPKEYWEQLAEILSDKYRISWQQGHKNIKKYIQWIQDCRLIVTADSLGQIIGIALNKKIISLWGPTNPQRMKGIESLKTLSSTLSCPHMPCYLPICKNSEFCMDYISPRKVAEICERMLP